MVLAELGSIKQGFNIAEYVQPDQVVFTDEKTKYSLLELAANRLSKCTEITSQKILEALLEREKIVSTGLGLGVALPHARIAGLKNYTLAIFINEQSVAWDARDGENVRIIFAILGPDDQQIKHLQIISSLAELIREDYSRSLLFSAKTKQQVLSILEGTLSSQ